MDDLFRAFSTPWVVALCLCSLVAALRNYGKLGWYWHLLAVPVPIALVCLTWCPLFGLVPALWLCTVLFPGRRF